MKMKKRFIVIGMGILGNSVAKTLVNDGAEVIAVDSSLKHVEEIKEHVQLAVQCDASDREALAQLGAKDVDGAIVCIGENFQATILATANLLDLGVKRIAARANNQMAASILKRIGAHDVFFVESEMGKEIAHKLHRPSIIREMELGDGYRIIQVKTPEAMAGKTLLELALPKNYGVQLVAIRSAHSVQVPSGETTLGADDLLLMCGHDRDLTKLIEKFRQTNKL